MKVFAEYFIEQGHEIRCNTLLQFGTSWELIGNVVLANPGSATPSNKPTNVHADAIGSFFRQFRNNEFIQLENWFEFKPDATMYFIEKIFSGWYVGRDIQLSGVIQLFNTFNLKNQNLLAAIAQSDLGSDRLFSHSVHSYFHDKPTYFGFSGAVMNHPTLRKKAIDIFENASPTVRRIYNADFSKNAFYHPIYVNRSYQREHFQPYRESILVEILS